MSGLPYLSRAGSVSEFVKPTHFLKILQCSACQEIPLPPIVMCEKGHSVCNDCGIRLQQCGFCRSKLTPVRNLLAESLVSEMTFHCKYRSDGCQQSVTGTDYSSHIENCQFRPIHCFETKVNQCNGNVVFFGDYFTHLKAHHQIRGSESPASMIQMYQHTFELTRKKVHCIWPLYYKQFDNQIFLLNTQIRNHVIHWWITVIGNEELASKYQARLVLYKRDDDRPPRVDWLLPIQPVRNKFEDLPMYAVYPTNALVNFCNVTLERNQLSLYTWFLDVTLYSIENRDREEFN